MFRTKITTVDVKNEGRHTLTLSVHPGLMRKLIPAQIMDARSEMSARELSKGVFGGKPRRIVPVKEERVGTKTMMIEGIPKYHIQLSNKYDVASTEEVISEHRFNTLSKREAKLASRILSSGDAVMALLNGKVYTFAVNVYLASLIDNETHALIALKAPLMSKYRTEIRMMIASKIESTLGLKQAIDIVTNRIVKGDPHYPKYQDKQDVKQTAIQHEKEMLEYLNLRLRGFDGRETEHKIEMHDIIY